MKRSILLILFLMPLGMPAQELDTIFANENHNTALFFPERIRQGIVGSPNFIFSYNAEHPQYFGLLKAIPGASSNLLVLTREGQIYSFVVSYRDSLPRLTHFLTKRRSLGNESREVKEPAHSELIKQKIATPEKQKHLEELSECFRNTAASRVDRERKNGLSLEVLELVAREDYVFIVFRLQNNSAISLEPEFLRVFRTQGNRRRNASFQKLLKEPVVRYRFPKILSSGEGTKFVFVYPKFSLGKGEKLLFEFREKRGNRFLELDLKRRKFRKGIQRETRACGEIPGTWST